MTDEACCLLFLNGKMPGLQHVKGQRASGAEPALNRPGLDVRLTIWIFLGTSRNVKGLCFFAGLLIFLF